MTELNRINAEFSGLWMNQKRIVRTLAQSGQASKIPHAVISGIEPFLGDLTYQFAQTPRAKEGGPIAN